MFEAKPLCGNTYYVNLPAKVGIYAREDGTATLIDGGSDARVAERIFETVTKNGWQVREVVVTHCHADHIGGCAFWEAHGARIFASEVDLPFVRRPFMNAMTLYGGYPHGEHLEKFFLAEPSSALPVTDDRFPDDINVFPLPGHSAGMIGVRTPDGVVFLGDMLAATSALSRYGMPFLFDVGAYLETAKTAAGLTARYFVPAHAPVSEDIKPLLAENVANVRENLAFIRTALQTPLSFETLLSRYFEAREIKMNLTQNYLVGCTLRCYLSYLAEDGEICERIEDNKVVYALAE